MKVQITRFDGGLRVAPCPVYLSKFLKYHHREMKSINFRRECVFTERLLYVTGQDRDIYTLPGFYQDIVHLISKNMDVAETVDVRSAMPEPDWDRVKTIKLRDYQQEPTLDLIFKGMQDSGVINAAGGFGIYM
jgi:hypothetical protein